MLHIFQNYALFTVNMVQFLSGKPKYRSHNAQNRRFGEISSGMFEKYKNSVRPHGCHIYNTSTDMAMEKCFPLPLNIMGYLTENVCYTFVISAQVLLYLFRRKIKIHHTLVQQYVFKFTVM